MSDIFIPDAQILKPRKIFKRKVSAYYEDEDGDPTLDLTPETTIEADDSSPQGIIYACLFQEIDLLRKHIERLDSEMKELRK